MWCEIFFLRFDCKVVKFHFWTPCKCIVCSHREQKIQGVQKIKNIVIARKPMVQLVSLPIIPFRTKMTEFCQVLALWEQKIHLQGVQK